MLLAVTVEDYKTKKKVRVVTDTECVKASVMSHIVLLGLIEKEGNISQAAKYVGLHRNTFVRWMKEAGYNAQDYKPKGQKNAN